MANCNVSQKKVQKKSLSIVKKYLYLELNLAKVCSKISQKCKIWWDFVWFLYTVNLPKIAIWQSFKAFCIAFLIIFSPINPFSIVIRYFWNAFPVGRWFADLHRLPKKQMVQPLLCSTCYYYTRHSATSLFLINYFFAILWGYVNLLLAF